MRTSIRQPSPQAPSADSPVILDENAIIADRCPMPMARQALQIEILNVGRCSALRIVWNWLIVLQSGWDLAIKRPSVGGARALHKAGVPAFGRGDAGSWPDGSVARTHFHVVGLEGMTPAALAQKRCNVRISPWKRAFGPYRQP